MARGVLVVLMCVVLVVMLTETPAASGARWVMDLSYDDTSFHLQEEYRRVDPQAAQVRLSMFLAQELQAGGDKKDAIRELLHQALKEHRRRLPQMRRQVSTSDGGFNATSLKKWFSSCVHHQAPNSFFQNLELRHSQKVGIIPASLNSIARRRKADKVKLRRSAVDGRTRGGSSRQREGGGRVRREDPAVMYLPLGGDSGDCPDSVDAAAVSISQLVYLSLSLGVFTAVANIANNINNNNNNNNNNNDNNINSNNLNFAANANAGNQITVQLPPPSGRGRRDLHALWQQHLGALRHRRTTRSTESLTHRLKERRHSGTWSGSLTEPDESEAATHVTTTSDVTSTSDPPVMALDYDVGQPQTTRGKDTNNVLPGSSLPDEDSIASLTKEQPKPWSTMREFRRYSTNGILSGKENLVSSLNDLILEEHHRGIIKIANRHDHYLPLQEVPRLLRHLYREYNPTEASVSYPPGVEDKVLTVTPTLTSLTLPTLWFSGGSGPGSLPPRAPVQDLLSSSRHDAPTIVLLTEDATSLSSSTRDVSPSPTSTRDVSPSPTSTRDVSPSPTSTRDVSPSSTSTRDVSPSSPSSTSLPTPPNTTTTNPSPPVSAEGIGATWALKAAMTWAVQASMSSPPCLGRRLCQLLKTAPQGSIWSHALAGYYLHTSLARHTTYTFTDYLREAQQGKCHLLFPKCWDSTLSIVY
ncbi:ras guanine nucleotide exchange factor glfB-like [Homarus americanus]|uniref:ras guanine nucleotide exchange factor glfB-like n=1 Tax=Homarus americanus TaxID=6706 RepID=UPI001C4552B8|nr:ras guanine nucleotide exchange factor glfB-like [Homarus americanus]